MHIAQACYRGLHDALLAYDGGSVYPDVLAPWLAANAGERRWLCALASRRGAPVPAVEVEDLWRLYALDRVNQILLLRFQRGEADGSGWPGPPITQEEYVAFAGALGLSVAREPSFSPFHHEIVEVELDDDPWQPVSLLGPLWPCLTLGDMLFSRAGVRVRGGVEILRKDVAESSTLYWAYRRKNRPHQDLSHGWGSNSQWRTAFRRDYRVGHAFHYNVDGRRDLLGAPELPIEDGEDDLTREERIELLTHRCFVSTTKPHHDLWPYDDRIRIDT
ncbi:hypothetical protein [Sorangium sp. So ce854]|uniref:Uncharacterized protein n=1 Tax=Sorangium cellulosum TaxID=56 RepID=A0A150PTR5_SORCE|nr:hypothetical protein BE08_28615 [Sorangium cellulosum]